MNSAASQLQQEDALDEADEPPGLVTAVQGGSLPLLDGTSWIEEAQCQDRPSKDNIPAIPSPLKPLRPVLSFRPSKKVDGFRRKIFPGVSVKDWNDWQWQLRHSFHGLSGLSRFLVLSAEEQDAVGQRQRGFPVGITPYYASLLDAENSMHPLRRAVVPVGRELSRSDGEMEDPLGEEGDAAVPGIVHRYPDRVLFLATKSCAVYCRYCTRSRLVGQGCQTVASHGASHGASNGASFAHWEKAISYIENTPSVRDVLISGGDPLTLDDESLEWLLSRLRAIKHVEIIRIGTKAPVVLPQRITRSLLRVIKGYHPVWMSIHFTHPDELTPEVEAACGRLADAGIPLGSQTVLLKGINDEVSTLKDLYQGLLRIRVRPYYLYQCDPIVGSSHFRTPVETGLKMIEGLRGHTSGYAVPSFVIDAPGGGGKIPLLPDYFVGREGNEVLLRNYQRMPYRYPDPVEGNE